MGCAELRPGVQGLDEEDMDKNNGGPAFPISIPGHGDNGACGMSLRDYFAAKAVNAYFQAFAPANGSSRLETCELVAEWSYAMADAMLRAREST